MRLSGVVISVLVIGSAFRAVSQKAVYRNHQYGIVLTVPGEALACMPPVYEGSGADHGLQILLGSNDPTLCGKSSGKRYMEVFASYTATDEEKTLQGKLESRCEFEVKRACSPAPSGLYIHGLRTEAGRLDRPDGSTEIFVVTMAGKPASDFDASLPSISYTLNLVTDARHIDLDLVTFRAMLKAIKIAP